MKASDPSVKMIRTRRLWRRLGFAAVLMALGWILFARLKAWNNQGELRLAQQEIARGELASAHRRLAALAARPGSLSGAADYWLGVTESLAGRPQAALEAFGQVPKGFAFGPVGAYHEARANLAQGKLLAAEQRLEQVLARGGSGVDQIRDLLGQIYQIEVRSDDVSALLGAALADAKDPIHILKKLNNRELDRLPYSGLQAALEKASQLAPEDSRVWLGKGRLAIESGRWEEAREWLQRCKRGPADAPVWKAWIELACATDQADKALEAARQLGPERLDIGARLELRAWFDKHRGDTRAEWLSLERWLRFEPTATQALERLAELAQEAGRSDQVTELRRRKSDVERALESYRLVLRRNEPLRGAAERYELGRRAAAAGRRDEARALYRWALMAEPDQLPIREALARLDQEDAARLRDVAGDFEPWIGSAVADRRKRPEQNTAPVGGILFTDDAETAGLRFIYDNAETPFHQLPEPFGGGLALLDYDGDGWLDVYCVQGGPFNSVPEPACPPPTSGDRLFHNRGDGTFDEVTEASGIGHFPRGHGHGVTVGDVDGDGCPDLFVTRWRSYALFHNKSDGTFEDITDRAGLGGDRDWPTSAALADLDGDGDLDLYVCHYARWDFENPRLCRDSANTRFLNCNPLDSAAMPDHLFSGMTRGVLST